MAASAVIGALRVNLGLNSASFRSGLDQSESRLTRFGRGAKVAFAAVGAAALAAAVAMGALIKGSIDSADEMSKLSQKTGVAIDVLSQLAYAGKYADIGVDTLGTSLIKLSKNMTDIAMGGGTKVQAAFDALGVSVMNADGTLRSADQVLYAVADRFATLPDGATKTALAVQLFGKAGAELIPLLNGGSEGLRAMAAESDRLGFTLNETTGKAAEAFNDNLTKLGAQFQGIANKIMVAILPALEAFSQWLVTIDPQTLSWATAIAGVLVLLAPVALGISTIAGAAGLAAPAIGLMTTALVGLNSQIALLAAVPAGVLALAGGFYLMSTTPVGAGEDALVQQMNDEWEKLKELREKLKTGDLKTDVDAIYAGMVGTDGQIQLLGDHAATIPIVFDQATDALDGTAAAAATVTDEVADAADKAETFADRVGAAFKSLGGDIKGLIAGTTSWNDVLINVLESVARIAFQQIDFTGGGTNGLAGDLVGSFIGGLFGFASGGSFKVGGSGGVDSQPVGFMASPDEVVSVMTPRQQKEAAAYEGGRNVTVNNTMNISTPDVRGFKQSEAQISGRLALATRRGARTL